MASLAFNLATVADLADRSRFGTFEGRGSKAFAKVRRYQAKQANGAEALHGCQRRTGAHCKAQPRLNQAPVGTSRLWQQVSATRADRA